MTANNLGAIPAVITFSHHIDLDQIQSTSIFLHNWYLQILGDSSKGNFNLGLGNTIQSPPSTSTSNNDITTLQGGSPLPLSALASQNTSHIYPFIASTSFSNIQAYQTAYTNAIPSIGKALSSTTNKDIAADQSLFPVLWLQDIQNAQLSLSSEMPGGSLVNSNSGAPDPTASHANYLLAELYVGLNNKGQNSNNGDVTYIEQFGLPLSLNVWYTDGKGNLYRGIQDQNGAGLSIPGAGSYITNGAFNPNANNASGLATSLVSGDAELNAVKLSSLDGTMYFNPKDLYAGTPSAIVNPKYGDFYDYVTYLKALDSNDYPIRWSGQFNQQQAYRVTGVSFAGFSNTSAFPEYDQSSSITLTLDWDNYSSPGGVPTPPIALKQSATIVIPWYGIPDGVSGIVPTPNQYTIANSSSNPNQPSGGWTLAWKSLDKTYSAGITSLTPFQNETNETGNVTPSTGGYQVAGLFNFYGDLFAYDSSSLSLQSKLYTLQQPNDPLLSISGLSENPINYGWQTLTLDGGTGDVAALQIRYFNNEWQFQGTNPSFWNGLGNGSTFSVPNGGKLPDGSCPIVTLNTAPDTQTALSDITFKPTTGVASGVALTEFKVIAADGTTIATLKLNDTYQANQLVNPNNFTYAASAAGALGANAGYYYRNGSSEDYTVALSLNNDLYGTAVGDFLSLVNAGLLGATQTFTYSTESGGQPITIGKLATLDTGYTTANGAIVASPWLDKINGPVAKGIFGSNAWNALPLNGLEEPFSAWASLINQYAPNVYGFGLSDRFKDGYDVGFNLERIDLGSLTAKQRADFMLLQFNTSAQTPEQAFVLVDGTNIDYLYPLFVEYQIGGFGQSTPGFLPDYPATEIIGGSLTPEGSLLLKETSTIVNSITFQELQQLGITLNDASISYLVCFDVPYSSAVLAVELTPLMESLAPADSTTLGSKSRRMTYYAVNNDGTVSSLNFNHNTRSGARFYDLTGPNGNPDSEVDWLSLLLLHRDLDSPSMSGDSKILQTSVAGTVYLAPLLTCTEESLLSVADPGNPSAPAAIGLSATVKNRPSRVNQVGYIVFDASEMSDTEMVLTDLATIKLRAQTLFSTLEDKDVTLAAEMLLQSEILVLNGQRVCFFEVEGKTLQEVTDISDHSLIFLSPQVVDDGRAFFVSVSGTQFEVAILTEPQGLNAMIAQEQGQAAVLDFTAFASDQAVVGRLSLGREADYDSITGFYMTVDIQGTVKDTDGNLVRPGDPRYEHVALRDANLVHGLTGLQIGDDLTNTFFIDVSEDTYLAPFANVMGNSFFAYESANQDATSHFRVMGQNIFGFEDTWGGGDRDYDDMILGFSFIDIL